MRYRLATEADIPALRDMRWDHSTKEAARSGDEYERFSARFAEFLGHALDGGRWAVWVAEDDSGEIVSHVYFQVIEKVPKPEVLRNAFVYMTGVYTKPQWRGKGIGGRLLPRAIASISSLDPDFIIVWPSGKATTFYEREGFRQVHDAWDLHPSNPPRRSRVPRR